MAARTVSAGTPADDAADIFFLIYLVLILHLTMVTSQDRLRERAQTEDEGIIFISILTVVAVGLSPFSILILLNKGDGPELDELLLDSRQRATRLADVACSGGTALCQSIL